LPKPPLPSHLNLIRKCRESTGSLGQEQAGGDLDLELLLSGQLLSLQAPVGQANPSLVMPRRGSVKSGAEREQLNSSFLRGKKKSCFAFPLTKGRAPY
jgi:hypothetical protein